MKRLTIRKFYIKNDYEPYSPKRLCPIQFKKYLTSRNALKVFTKATRNKSLFAPMVATAHNLQQPIRSFRNENFGKYRIVYEATYWVLPQDNMPKVITRYSLKEIVDAAKLSLQTARAEQRELITRVVTLRLRRPNAYTDPYGRFHSERIGGVRHAPGFFLNLKAMRDVRLVFENKRPKTDENHVGLELEFTASLDREKLGQELFKAGLAEFVTLKHDGSIRVEKQGHYAHELVICVPQSKIDSVVKSVTSVLSGADATVNKSTGFHVHIDVRNRDRNKVFGRLVAAQGLLYAMQPASRRDNDFCKRTTSRDRYTAEKIGRYQGVNPHSISKHGSVEVRLHAGTVSFEKIVNWTMLLIAIADGDTALPPRAPRKLDSFCKVFNIGGALREYIKARLDKFANVTDDQAEAS